MMKICGSERITVQFSLLHNEALCDLFGSLSVIWVMESRRLRWTRHVSVYVRHEIRPYYWVPPIISMCEP
jgi:hypothetical protein